MAQETTHIAFTHKELVELLVRHQGLNKGIWGLFVEFGIGAANVGPSDEELLPTAVVPVIKIGLQRFPKLTSLSVDAAKVNPLKSGDNIKSLRGRKPD
ncbi:MAG TPA: hypothetical protein VJA16_24165 [Thermoanaerobaculia bacterium]